MRDTTAKLAYSTDEASATLSIGRTALFDLLRRNEIASVKIGRRRLILATSLDAYLARLVADQTGGHRETGGGAA